MAQGKSNQAIAEELFLSKRAVEKHINSIFMKLGLAHQDDVSRRVKAALIYLAGVDTGDGSRPCDGSPGASASRPSSRASATASERERTSSLR